MMASYYPPGMTPPTLPPDSFVPQQAEAEAIIQARIDTINAILTRLGNLKGFLGPLTTPAQIAAASTAKALREQSTPTPDIYVG